MKSLILRFFRVAFSVAIAGSVQVFHNDPSVLAIAPALNALGKAIRLIFPKSASWLPF